jgi:hypothetical protein
MPPLAHHLILHYYFFNHNQSITPQMIKTTTFREVFISNVSLLVPEKAIFDYLQTNIWKNFRDIMGIAVIGVSLDKANITLNIGDTKQLTVNISPTYALDKTIIWVSSNSTIAARYSGTITALEVGMAIITAITNDGGFTAECLVTVNPATTPIRDVSKTNNKKFGILLEKSIVSDKAEMLVKLPNDKVAETKIVIYDNIGNVVFETLGKSAETFTWNLKNKAGRFMGNGSYLIVAEAKGASGKVYRYSEKIGVKR